ncbi:MAG TPA: branched-chain amino acid ABC transporter permease [Ktedonobacterales bacterium]|jgi:branched-chain amino acid transport system permease protein|nr:branched-chain amino acid ABC transporter permease [Ktedonobacterales bacterium]
MANPTLVLELALVGIAFGALYSLAALGIVLIYKTTGVLNFAHGAIGMFSTFIAYEFGVVRGWPAPVAVLLALAFAALFGWFMERFTLRPLRNRPVLTRVIVTLGWLLVLQSVASLIWKDTSYHIPLQLFPQNGIRIAQLTLGYNQLANIIIAAALAILLAVFLRFAPLGIAMRATSDNPTAAQLLGIRVNMVAATSWILGSVTAAIAGLLLAPLTTLNTTQLTIVVITAFGAALIGGLTNLPLTFLGGIFLGVTQSLLILVVPAQIGGAKDVLTFAVILGVLLLRKEVRVLAISAMGGDGL